MSDDFFGDIIYSYTRKQAIEDGVLVEVDWKLLSAFGFRLPMVITIELWHDVVAHEKEAVLNMNLRQFLTSIYMAIYEEKYGKDGGNKSRFPYTYFDKTVMVDIGPDDDCKPCLTVGYPSDF